MSDERRQIELAKLSLRRRFQRALGFDRIFAEVDRIEIELAEGEIGSPMPETPQIVKTLERDRSHRCR